MFRLFIISLLCCVACGPSSDSSRFDPALDGLSVLSAQPTTLVPQSRLVIGGRSFVGEPWGTPFVLLEGDLQRNGETNPLSLRLPARFIDLETLEVAIDDSFINLVVANAGDFEGEFHGLVKVEIESAVDNQPHFSSPLEVTLDFKQTLSPTVSTLYGQGPLFVNDNVRVTGGELLLGGDEGTSYAVVNGCFQKEGEASCDNVTGERIPLVPASPFDRTQADFAFIPQLAGIEEGQFVGTVIIENEHNDGTKIPSGSHDVTYDLLKTRIFGSTPNEVSLGQYVHIQGGGFIETQPGASTLLELSGEFTPAGGRGLALDLVLIPEYVDGRALRYIMNEDDTLGQKFDVRYTRGRFDGTLIATTSFNGTTVSSDPVPFTVDLAPVKQVIYLQFTPQYLDGLRAFGMRAMDSRIRQRVKEVVERDFRTINVDVRLEKPDDFSLYSTVEVGGKDPNGLGLLGYDNTPGKDVGNDRLHDHIGGINVVTQQDGFPGYGGVFVESLFVFSKHPGSFAPKSSLGSDLFDDIFDVFRPDQGGKPIRAADLSAAWRTLKAATFTTSPMLRIDSWTQAAPAPSKNEPNSKTRVQARSVPMRTTTCE
jgi:hypothetical protein